MSTTDLFQSIRCDDGEAVLEALRTCDLNQINELNQTLLQEAIAFGQWDVARELIERGIDLNRTDYQGATALHFAAAYSATELVERILAKGGACDVADAHGNEALWTATFNAKGKYAIVALLLKYGADPGHKNKAGRSPLELAQRMGYRQLAALLGGTDDAKTE